VREPARQAQAGTDIRAPPSPKVVELYATNCVVCHGATGEGMGAYPAAGQQGVREMDAEDTACTPSSAGATTRRWPRTALAEGGIFTDMQVRSLVAHDPGRAVGCGRRARR
jgi:mono/diheme cytochrome c family protein